VFGRFSEPDTFIGLTWNYREILDWNEEVHGCKEEWNKLFPHIPPFVGKALNEYVTYNATAV
jgi:hypothetical protein